MDNKERGAWMLGDEGYLKYDPEAIASPAMARNADAQSGPAASGAVVPPSSGDQWSARLATTPKLNRG